MMIQVKHDYRGVKTNYLLIPAGTYPEGDKRLFGLEEYLIQQRHAVQFFERAAGGRPLPPAPPEPEIQDALDLLDDNALRQLALDEGIIQADAALSREQLLAELREWGVEPDAEPSAPLGAYADWTAAALREEAKQRSVSPVDEEGHVVSLSKATKPQLIAALSAVATDEDEETESED
jgi:hypothetical protein